MKSGTPANARTVQSEWAEWDLTTETWQSPRRATLEEYRPDGKLAFSESRFGEGPVCRCSNSYDEAGLLIESQFRSGDGPAGRQFFHYDDDGRLIRLVGRLPDGSERVVEDHVYGPGDEHTKISHIPPIEGVTDFQCPIDGTDYSFNAPGTTTITTAFDSRGRVSETLLKDANGGVLRRVVLTRDESGRLVKDEILLGAEPLYPDLPMFAAGAALQTSEYTYDERGRCVELVRRMSGLSERRETYCYDDHGNKTESTTQNQRREANVSDGNIEYGAAKLHRQQARFAYKYDARGNWTERLMSQRHGENADFTPCSIERREIAYYDERNGHR